MKKQNLLFTVVLVTFAIIGLAGCGASDSVYWEDWFETNGYVESASVLNERTGETDNNSTFIAGEHPEDKSVAVRHEHRYTRSLNCTFTVKKLGDDLEKDIVNELIEDESKTKRFTIPTNSNFEKIEGFIFYCDNENVYVVNNLYKDNYVDHNDSNTNPQYRFEISINGIKTLKIDMDYKQVKNNRPY